MMPQGRASDLKQKAVTPIANRTEVMVIILEQVADVRKFHRLGLGL